MLDLADKKNVKLNCCRGIWNNDLQESRRAKKSAEFFLAAERNLSFLHLHLTLFVRYRVGTTKNQVFLSLTSRQTNFCFCEKHWKNILSCFRTDQITFMPIQVFQDEPTQVVVNS